jgi:hypothetical protein
MENKIHSGPIEVGLTGKDFNLLSACSQFKLIGLFPELFLIIKVLVETTSASPEIGAERLSHVFSFL